MLCDRLTESLTESLGKTLGGTLGETVGETFHAKKSRQESRRESRIGLYAWLPARVSPRLVFFTRVYGGRKCKKLLDWNDIWYLEVFGVADYESKLEIH